MICDRNALKCDPLKKWLAAKKHEKRVPMTSRELKRVARNQSPSPKHQAPPTNNKQQTTTLLAPSCSTVVSSAFPCTRYPPHKLLGLSTQSHLNMSFVRSVRLRVPSCAARPGPAIGQALGPLGINMAEFCKQFNEKTESLGYKKDIPLSVTLNALSDRTFTFDVKTPPTSYLLKKAAGIEKGPNHPNADQSPSGFVTPEMIYEIAAVKLKDSNRWHLPLEGVARSVVGTARSMGIQVREATEEK